MGEYISLFFSGMLDDDRILRYYYLLPHAPMQLSRCSVTTEGKFKHI